MAWRTVHFNANGGTLNSQTPLYWQTSPWGPFEWGYWTTTKTTGGSYVIQSITKPTRKNYIFTGFWSSSEGTGTKFVHESGDLVRIGISPTDGVTIYAGWRGYAIITLDNGEYGSGGTSTIYYKVNGGGFYSNTSLTSAITKIKIPTGGGTFGGYSYNGQTVIDSDGNITTSLAFTTDVTFIAKWVGGCVDYFGLASDALIPISSTTGDTRHRVAVSHGGKYESGVNEVGGIWRNPSVTYVVKSDTTVSIQLGKAWAATFTGSGSERKMTVSGYMTTTVEIVTEVGKFPTVTVSAVANEGANAINNFTENKDKFNVSVPVVARSKAQNLLGAISGGGHLQSCRLVAACDPVVCEENLMPCASDIVNGRYELSAETLAPNGEAAPTMTAASGKNGGFALIDDPRQGRDCDFIRYTIEARKEMV